MQDKPCSWGTEPVRGWQIPVAEGRDSVLTLSLPELHDGMGWPQPGHVGTGSQDGPPSTQTTDSVQNPGPPLLSVTRGTQICLSSPFLSIVPALEHQTSASASRTPTGETCTSAETLISNHNRSDTASSQHQRPTSFPTAQPKKFFGPTSQHPGPASAGAGTLDAPAAIPGNLLSLLTRSISRPAAGGQSKLQTPSFPARSGGETASSPKHPKPTPLGS